MSLEQNVFLDHAHFKMRKMHSLSNFIYSKMACSWLMDEVMLFFSWTCFFGNQSYCCVHDLCKKCWDWEYAQWEILAQESGVSKQFCFVLFCFVFVIKSFKLCRCELSNNMDIVKTKIVIHSVLNFFHMLLVSQIWSEKAAGKVCTVTIFDWDLITMLNIILRKVVYVFYNQYQFL